MAYTVLEHKEGSECGVDVDKLQAVRVFTVDFDSEVTIYGNPITAIDATGIPLVGDVHPSNAWLFCKAKHCKHELGNTYKVTAQYESIDDPTAIPYEVEWDFGVTSEDIDTAYDPSDHVKDKPIRNSSDEPFDPPVKEDKYDQMLKVSFYATDYNAEQAMEYINTVNSSAWFGYNAGNVLLTKYGGVKTKIGSTYYYKLTFEFQTRYDGWKKRILDQGLREKNGSGDYTPFKDSDGNPVTTPVLLNGSGAQTDTPTFLEFEVKNESDFGLLPVDIYLI